MQVVETIVPAYVDAEGNPAQVEVVEVPQVQYVEKIVEVPVVKYAAGRNLSAVARCLPTRWYRMQVTKIGSGIDRSGANILNIVTNFNETREKRELWNF